MKRIRFSLLSFEWVRDDDDDEDSTEQLTPAVGFFVDRSFDEPEGDRRK